MDSYLIIKLIHKIVVVIFLLIYLVKTILLLTNKTAPLLKFSKTFKVPEMIVSFLFLATGAYLLWQKADVNNLMLFKLIAVFISIPLAVVGFKKSNKILASLSLLLIIASYGLAEVSSKRMSKKELNTAVITDSTNPSYDIQKHGKEIFTQYCINCHGENGKKGLGGATDLSKSILDDAGMNIIITKGKGGMPSVKGVLNEQDVNAVIAYIKNFKE